MTDYRARPGQTIIVVEGLPIRFRTDAIPSRMDMRDLLALDDGTYSYAPRPVPLSADGRTWVVDVVEGPMDKTRPLPLFDDVVEEMRAARVARKASPGVTEVPGLLEDLGLDNMVMVPKRRLANTSDEA